MKKSSTTPVLRTVKNAKVKPTTAPAGTSARRGQGITCAQAVGNTPTRYNPPVINGLFSKVDAMVLADLHRHLTAPRPPDAYMLDAWERVGRQDALRGDRAYLSRAAATTVSALGLACLIRYARGFEDETDARAAASVVQKHD